jgi:transcription factor MBP1
LAKQYGVDRLLQPIFDFVAGAESPPLAPKHITAPPVRPKKHLAAAALAANGGEGEDGGTETKSSARLSGKPTKASIAASNKALKAAAKVAKQAAAAATKASTTSTTAAAARKKKAKAKAKPESDEDVPVLEMDNVEGRGGRESRESDEKSQLSPTPSEGSSASETPSPLGGSSQRNQSRRHEDDMEEDELDDDDDEYTLSGEAGPSMKKRKLNNNGGAQYSNGDHQQHNQQHQQPPQHQQQEQYPASAHNQLGSGPLLYARMILDYFVSESTQVPPFLITPPADFDANVIIDDDGHTALHWACAMGRIRIVKLLLTAGADIFRANSIGQTALMRSVMFTNNYDLRKFPELFELLHRSTINIDRQDRTVFHYIVDIALQKGKTHAARYYLETVLSRLVDYPQEVADILNFQDEEGETALTLAARARSKRIVKILLDNGADPKITNRDGKNAEDYILEDERFRENDDRGFQAGLVAVGSSTSSHPSSQPQAPAPSLPSAQPVQLSLDSPPSGSTTTASILFAPQLHTSTSGQLASHTCIPRIATLLESLASSFDSELLSTTSSLTQASLLLANLQTEIADSMRIVEGLKKSAEGLEELGERERGLEKSVGERMGKRFRLGWEKWVRDEEGRSTLYDEATATATAAGGKREEDLDALNALRGLSESEIREKAIVARGMIERLAEGREQLFETLVGLQGEAGTGGKMREYKTLIALGCGVPLNEVEGVLDELCDTLENGGA